MKESLLKTIVCPYCKKEFELNTLYKKDNEIITGELICNKCDRHYSIIEGIPIILPDDVSKIKERTAQRFSYEWKNFSQLYKEYEKQFLDWIYPVKKEFFKNKNVLDVGCGTGRHVYYSVKFGAKEVIGVDLGDTVKVSHEYAKKLPNAHIIQADLYYLPFRDNYFDYVYSMGVLHHLPNPEAGFKSILKKVKKAGAISTWVYGREGNTLLKIMNPIRKRIFTKLPLGFLKAFSFGIMLFLHPMFKLIYKPLNENRYTKKIARFFPQNSFFYYLSGFNFKTNHSILFDQFIAPIANYYKKEEFEKWHINSNLKNIEITWRNKNSWRGFGEICG